MAIQTEPKILVAEDFAAHLQAPARTECDCACSDASLILAPLSSQPATGLLKCATVYQQRIDDQHTLLFNVNQHNGPAVLNTPAHELWSGYRTPQPYDHTGHTHLVHKLLQRGLLTYTDAELIPHRGAPKTLSVWMHVTNECNLRCDYCYITKTSDSMPEATGRLAVDATFRSATLHGFSKIKLKFAGGEAAMNLKRVLDICDYAKARSMQEKIDIDCVILSNGVALSERAIEALLHRDIRVSISLDGVGDWHDAQRKFTNGKGSFHIIDRTLERLINRGVKPFISVTVSGRNAAGLPEIVQYLRDRDLPFNLNFFCDNECAKPHRDLAYEDDLIISSMNKAFDVLEQNLPAYSLLGSLIDRSQFSQAHEKTCSVGDAYLVIDHHGQIAKCQMEIEQPITSVHAQDPLGDLQSDRKGIQNLRVDEKEGCRDCEWRYWCAGGCPALTFRVTGRYDIKSPNCRIYKAIYPRLLRLEALRLISLTSEVNPQ